MDADSAPDSSGEDRPTPQGPARAPERDVLDAAQRRSLAGSPRAFRAVEDGLSPLQLLAPPEALRAHPAGAAGCGSTRRATSTGTYGAWTAPWCAPRARRPGPEKRGRRR